MSDATTTTTWTLLLPSGPLLTLNMRAHWSYRAKVTKLWRDATYWTAKETRIPKCRRVHVELHAAPPDRRRRDPANYAPLVKACVDGIVDAGVVGDDDPDHVDPVQPVLFHPPETRWRWWLEVTEVTGQEAA